MEELYELRRYIEMGDTALAAMHERSRLLAEAFEKIRQVHG